jgi:hypothetical protein
VADQGAPLALTGQQRALHRALVEKDPYLATMYFGARIVLTQPQNPDRLALAAHGIRELMEKLPIYLGLEMKAQKEALKAKVIELHSHWETGITKTQCHQQGQWQGEIDKHLRKLLQCCHTFFDWFKAHTPRRKDEFVSALRRMDISGRALPGPLEGLNVRAWDELRSFFQAVAHHQKEPGAQDFDEWLDALERFLLDRLSPRTCADLDVLDEIIREGESHGK